MRVKIGYSDGEYFLVPSPGCERPTGSPEDYRHPNTDPFTVLLPNDGIVRAYMALSDQWSLMQAYLSRLDNDTDEQTGG